MTLVQRPLGAHATYLLRPDYIGLARFLAEPREDVLGAVVFGQVPETPGLVPVPLMPACGADLVECWRGRPPVQRGAQDDISYAHDGVVLFASLANDGAPGIEHAAEDAYRRLLVLTEGLGYPHVLRAWNHFPDIHGDENGLDRYRRFNIGRHRALATRLRAGWVRPAASVIGTRTPGLRIYLLASAAPGQVVDNPRQTRPCRYPPQYGPRPPDFSRAIKASLAGRRYLFISGTAAIQGHVSQSREDPIGQLDETLKNLDAVLRAGGVPDGAPITALKIYTSGAAPERFAERIAAWLPHGASAAHLIGDICRAELTVEIEAFVSSGEIAPREGRASTEFA
ncbi:MAG: chorismate transformation enzyme, FkbO/Hyg5 family [Acidiferrobacteraceae bacterium]